MKKLITLCTILAICAFTAAHAQTATVKTKDVQTQKNVHAKDVTLQQVIEKAKTEPASEKTNVKATTSSKSGEHAPDADDPDYNAKFREWIKNYPEEYNTYLNNSKPEKK